MDREQRKGTFSNRRLPVARAYVTPISRSLMIVLGTSAGALLLAFTVLDFFVLDAHFLSNGPLSRQHAMLEAERDCASCHAAAGGVPASGCAACHEPVGEAIGRYGWGAHAVYVSGDVMRAASAHETDLACASCHVEHRGRDAEITLVADAQCVSCHGESSVHRDAVGSFERAHPEFDFVAAAGEEPGGLAFTHSEHLLRLREKGYEDAEKACLYCHAPEPGGRHFEPLAFERACDACHLQEGESLEDLPLRTARNPVGVEDLAAMRRRGERWALFANPAEYILEDGVLAKDPLYHADPWVLENLRRLRSLAHPEGGLANLLPVSAAGDWVQPVDLYREAVEALRVQILTLRGRAEAEVHAELSRLQALLVKAETRLARGGERLDPAAFTQTKPGNVARRAEIAALAEQLTSGCEPCHRLEELAIARVDESQRALSRARFDHGAHALQRRCLECHDRIQVFETEVPEEYGDHAGIRNVPGIDSCRECHTASAAGSRCVGCHDFHPSSSRPVRLLRYVD